jgi:acyl carrier protein
MAVEARLMDELIGTVRAIAAFKGIPLPGAPADIASAAFEVDSLVVVSILCAVEPTLGFELSESVVRTGGYSSVRSAVDQLIPRIEAQWVSKKGSTT